MREQTTDNTSATNQDVPSPEFSVDALRGIEEMLFCMRDACNLNGIRENKSMGQGLDFLAYAMKRHVDIIEDALFPGRRHL
jgi:hypothetical protein